MKYTVHPRFTAIALMAVVVATACSASPRPQAAPPSPTTTTSSPAPATSPTATPTPSATPRPEPAAILTDERTIALGLTADVLVPAGPIVYALGTTKSTVTVARIDVAAKTATARRTFDGEPARASLGGGRLALLTPPATVRELDPKTLETLAIRTLTGPAGDVLARPEATYVSTPGRILALDPGTLRTERSFRVDADPSGAFIAADPRSSILYAGIQSGSTSYPRVDILDLRTGDVLAGLARERRRRHARLPRHRRQPAGVHACGALRMTRPTQLTLA